jgi:hypothetical protein
MAKEDITEKINNTRNGRIMGIKENFYIYLYKHHKRITDDEKANENNHKNILFDTATEYADKPS